MFRLWAKNAQTDFEALENLQALTVGQKRQHLFDLITFEPPPSADLKSQLHCTRNTELRQSTALYGSDYI